jgi:predicted SprT family Zn-dependent metalloprotease
MRLDYGDARTTQPTRSFSKKVIQNSWEFQNRFDYENNVYFRGKSMLDNIERLVGEKKMQELLHAYFDKWKFKHPNTNDFQTMMEAVTNVSWEAYLNKNLYNSEKLAGGKSIQVETVSEGNGMNP